MTFVCPPRLRRLLSSGARSVLSTRLRRRSRSTRRSQSAVCPCFQNSTRDRFPPMSPICRRKRVAEELWAERIGAAGFKVGVVWQGNPNPEADRARSFPLAALAPLAGIAGVRLISLQKGYGEEQLAGLPSGMRVESLGPDFDAGSDAFVDTAAAMTQCDLIVTCDTSIAHLAGALARPVWVALKSDAEWRWMRERADSPWYPTMRLFRQSQRGVWSDVVDAMARELAETRSHRASPRMIVAPCSIGELVDKITILRIKTRRISDEDKLRNVRRELAMLEELATDAGLVGPSIASLTDQLDAVNARLWDIEDAIRIREREGRVRIGVRRAGAVGLRQQRRTRRPETSDKQNVRFGDRGGKELRLSAISRECRSSVPSMQTDPRASARSRAHVRVADADDKPPTPNDLGAPHFAGFIDMHRYAPRQSNVARKCQFKAVERTVADPAFAHEAKGRVQQLRRTQAHLLARRGALFVGGVSVVPPSGGRPNRRLRPARRERPQACAPCRTRLQILALDPLEHGLPRAAPSRRNCACLARVNHFYHT